MIWTLEDALQGRCSVPEVGCVRLEAQEATPAPPGARQDRVLALAYAPRALRALARVMEASDGRAAVEAAKELLARAYGPPQAQEPGAVPRETLPEPQEVQAWLTRFTQARPQALPGAREALDD
jgi:hypothetical protein